MSSRVARRNPSPQRELSPERRPGRNEEAGDYWYPAHLFEAVPKPLDAASTAFSPRRYEFPQRRFVDQTMIASWEGAENLRGKYGASLDRRGHSLCMRCGQTRGKHHANFLECKRTCRYCDSKDHQGDVCPKIYCSESWWKKRLGKALVPRNVQLRPSLGEIEVLKAQLAQIDFKLPETQDFEPETKFIQGYELYHPLGYRQAHRLSDPKRPAPSSGHGPQPAKRPAFTGPIGPKFQRTSQEMSSRSSSSYMARDDNHQGDSSIQGPAVSSQSAAMQTAQDMGNFGTDLARGFDFIGSIYQVMVNAGLSAPQNNSGSLPFGMPQFQASATAPTSSVPSQAFVRNELPKHQREHERQRRRTDQDLRRDQMQRQDRRAAVVRRMADLRHELRELEQELASLDDQPPSPMNFQRHTERSRRECEDGDEHRQKRHDPPIKEERDKPLIKVEPDDPPIKVERASSDERHSMSDDMDTDYGVGFRAQYN